MEVALIDAPFSLRANLEEEEVQVSWLLVLAMLMEPAIIKVVEEEELISMSLLVIEDVNGVLQTVAKLLIGEAIEGT